MFKSRSKKKTQIFTYYLQSLGENASDKIVEGFQKSEKDLVKRFVVEAQDLIDHNEWERGLENLLDNIYEIDFPVDEKAIVLAKEAIRECGLEYKKWVFIEELVK